MKHGEANPDSRPTVPEAKLAKKRKEKKSTYVTIIKHAVTEGNSTYIQDFSFRHLAGIGVLPAVFKLFLASLLTETNTLRRVNRKLPENGSWEEKSWG